MKSNNQINQITINKSSYSNNYITNITSNKVNTSQSTNSITNSLSKTQSKASLNTTDNNNNNNNKYNKINNLNYVTSINSISNASSKSNKYTNNTYEIVQMAITPIKMQLTERNNKINPTDITKSESESMDSDLNNLSLNEKVGLTSFVCLGILGKGSFGVVYLVQHKNNKKLFAMKILSKNKIMGK